MKDDERIVRLTLDDFKFIVTYLSFKDYPSMTLRKDRIREKIEKQIPEVKQCQKMKKRKE